MHLTIVDDSTENLHSYKQLLGGHFQLELISEPLEVLGFLLKNQTDALILDLHMPSMNGFDLFKKIRELDQTPVIFLSADPSEDVRIEGLELGAEDFISKPISVKELIARIKNKAIKSKTTQGQEDLTQVHELEIDWSSHIVKVNNKEISLTPIEFKMLAIFIKNPNQMFGREEISKILWPKEDIQIQKIDTHLSNLRKKTAPFSSKIKTIKSRGYILRV